eukprot:203746_1
MAAVAEDLTYFRADSSIRRKKYCGLCYFNHILYRYCDVFLRGFFLMCIWVMFNGFVVVIMLGLDFLGAIISASVETKSINFEMLSCMAATPLSTKRLRCASLV